MYRIGLDCGSTTVKALVADEAGRCVWRDYRRHAARVAETVLDFLERIEREAGALPAATRVFVTGSACSSVAPLIGAKHVQEVVAVAAAVEKFHPQARFVSEIGGEDMKTIFLAHRAGRRSKQVMMQSACAGGTGNFIEKIAHKLGVAERIGKMAYAGLPVHKVSPKCGIFAEADANSLLQAGVPVEEIIASLFDAVVCQNIATLVKGNTPAPEVLLLGGPNLFFGGLQEAWRHHLTRLWQDRKVDLPAGAAPGELVRVPEEALYYGCRGCIELAGDEAPSIGVYAGAAGLRRWLEEGRHEQQRREGRRGLWETDAELEAFLREYGRDRRPVPAAALCDEPLACGIDFGSTTAKFVLLGRDKSVAGIGYEISRGNPIEDAKTLFRQIEAAAGGRGIATLGVTGYGKDLLKDIVGADAPVVETVAHASAGLHFFPDADSICDVGGVDVKIMLLRQGTVSDFRLNSQCSSGNGAFLHAVAERFGIPLDEIATHALGARAMPQLAMGCGVFLQSELVNQQRNGWQAGELLAALCAVLPVNVWIYAGAMPNLAQIGRKFILQGGTHRNLAVVKAQADFIRARVPDAQIVVHPYCGEAGALGAALVAMERQPAQAGGTRFRGFEAIEALRYRSRTSADTACRWCAVQCKRTFVDVEMPGASGRPWSKVPLAANWQRVIVNNSCPKGLVEDVNEMRSLNAGLEKEQAALPNIAGLVREHAFRGARCWDF